MTAQAWLEPLLAAAGAAGLATLILFLLEPLLRSPDPAGDLAASAYARRARRGAGAVLTPVTAAVPPLLLGALAAAEGPHRITAAAWIVLAVAAGLSPWLLRIDLALHRLPDRIVLPAAGTLTGVLALAAMLPLAPAEQGAARRMLTAALVATAVALVLWALPLILTGAGGVGLGDVKFMPVVAQVAVSLHWGGALVALAVMALSAGVVAGAGLLRGRLGLRSRIAYGPHLILGMWAGAASGVL